MSQEFITFKVNRSVIYYIAAYVQDAAVKAAMAKALITSPGGMEDELQVTIHEAQIVTIYGALANVPAGIGAKTNEALKAMIVPYMDTNPRMAGMIAEVTGRNQAAREQVLQSGEKELQRIIHLLSIN